MSRYLNFITNILDIYSREPLLDTTVRVIANINVDKPKFSLEEVPLFHIVDFISQYITQSINKYGNGKLISFYGLGYKDIHSVFYNETEGNKKFSPLLDSINVWTDNTEDYDTVSIIVATPMLMEAIKETNEHDRLRVYSEEIDKISSIKHLFIREIQYFLDSVRDDLLDIGLKIETCASDDDVIHIGIKF